VPRHDALPLSLPPRGLNREQAAAYVGVCPDVFDRLVKAGEMPQPVRFQDMRRVIWDRQALDHAFDRRSSLLQQVDAPPAKSAMLEAIRGSR